MDNIKKILFPWTAINDKEEQKGGGAGGTIAGLMVMIIIVVVGIVAAYLAWTCNAREDMGLRIIYTCLAFANAIPYIIYYLIVRVLLGYECKCCT